MRTTFPNLELHFIDEGCGYKLAHQITRTPRMMKNHLPPHLAPREIFSHLRKNILVVRNPKDTALSHFNFYKTERTLKGFMKTDNLEEFLNLFLEGKVFYGSWWDWNKAWIKKYR